MKIPKIQGNYRLSAETKEAIKKIAKLKRMSEADVLEIAIDNYFWKITKELKDDEVIAAWEAGCISREEYEARFAEE